MRIPLVLATVLTASVSTLRAQELPLDSLLQLPVSTAAKYAQTMTQAAASLTVITAEDIRRHGYRSLDELLRRVPGYYSTYDRNYAYIGVRGFGRPGDYNNRILLLLNGHAMTEGVFGSVPGGTDLALDPSVIERVEVIHGPGSALYGTGAMLTSINIVTFNGRAVNGVRLTSGGGSMGSRHASVVAGTALSPGADISIAGQWSAEDGGNLHYPEFDSIGGGIARGRDWENNRSALLRFRAGGIAVNAFVGTRSKGIPTGAYGTDFNDARSWTRDLRSFVEARYASAGNTALHFDVGAYFSHYGYVGSYPYGISTTDTATNDVVGAETRLRWDLGSRNRLLVGMDVQRHVRADYWAGDDSVVYLDQHAPFGVFSVYVQDEFEVARGVTMVLGLRHDVDDRSGGSTSPRLALILNPSRHTTVKLLYGEAFRAPSMYETTFEDSQYRPNPDLRAERIRSAEAVWEQRVGPSVFASLSVHQFRMRDLVDTYLDPADSMLQFRNVTLATSTGASLALNARLPSGTNAYLSYAEERTRDGAGAIMSNSPEHVAQLGVSVPATTWSMLSAETRWESSRGTVYGTRTGGLFRTDLHLLLTPRGFLERTELSVALRNALGARYATPGGYEHLQAVIPQDGRTLSVRLRVRI